MSTNPEQDALHARWTLEGRIPLSGVADGAVWRRARSVATGESVVLFIVRGEAALEAADAVRRAYLVEEPRLLPVREIVVLDDPREESDTTATGAPEDGPTTVVEYPMPPAPPLAALLTDGPMHPETARAIIGEAATGLEAARRRGVRHQFLDSNRVFVDTRSGGVHILGIGVEAASHPGLDRSREVASFQDTAALVALLYRALTGRTPQHDGTGTVPRPSTLVDTDIPADLDLLCDLVLNESADDIPETTRGLIEALEPWQSIPVTFEAYPRGAAGGASGAGAASGDDDRPEAAAETAGAVDAGSATRDAREDEERGAAGPAVGAGAAAAGAAGAVTGAAVVAGTTAAQEPSGSGADAGVTGGDAGESTAALSPVDDAAERAGEEQVVDERSADSRADEAQAAASETAPVSAASAATTGENAPTDDGASAGQDAPAGEETPAAPREDHSAAAATLVKDLHLDEKRGTSPFPGHLDITQPRRPQAEAARATDAEQDSAASGTGAAGAAGLAAAAGAAGAAGAAAAQSPSAQHSPSAGQSPSAAPEATQQIPSRTSGTHWPLSPAGSPAGSDGRAEQPGAGAIAPTADHAAPTPSVAPQQSSDAEPNAAAGEDEPTAAMPAVGAAAGPAAHETGPIVVQGRRTSYLDEAPEETTVPHSRGSLLRDVVGVAVDADDPDTFALGPRDREKRSLQSQWIVVGGVIVVMLALVFAVTAITRDLREIIADPLATAQPETTTPVEEDTGEAPAEPTPTDTEEPELPAPELTGVEVFTQGTDLEPDNADQQDRMTDGDPGTFWSTKHYQSADYGGLKEGAGVRLTFAEQSTLRTVKVTTARNTGGLIELRAVHDDGSLGDVLTSGELAGDGEVLLETPEPVEADEVALWIPELPPDSNEQGRYRARIAEIQVG
ncbi:hypothetical protein [Brachybacterium paraconglomeratum]|uniref:hypothetical protein n=1 Tax=Brachybacterium paraconglomeratum TaxID=173362 RepID=UPI0022E2915A|nr:hypothetical protein [Brachybacterium paraconglomeratum]